VLKSAPMGIAPYSILVTYDTSFKQGPQEGIVEVQLTNTLGIGPYAAVMVKVLLDPQPNVALGPMSCPVALQQPGYWESNFGIAPTTVTCGNLKGPAYIDLLALVTVSPADGKPGHLYVYDLTHAPPVQLFSMQTASAVISSASTIVTADVDPGSSTNKVTPDLFREFAWSGSAFVQVAFAGMYPDLTRWQADADQVLVNLGQDTWKRDALKTAENFVAQFLPSPASNPPKLELVFGGGPQDPQAYVNVSFPTAIGRTHPVTRLTLSRLERNANSIWEVTAVQADWMSISSPQRGQSINTPVTVSGSGPTFEGQIGGVQVLDHLYKQIGSAAVMAPEGATSRPFTVTFPYTSSFKAGAQEGIVELVHRGGAPFDYGAVLVKVLVNP
jgi:Immunoglobulin-like domain of bacterial spore germination